MADETVNDGAELLPLQDVAHAQSNELWDVIAIIEAAREVPSVERGDSGDRLLSMALQKLKSVQDAFNPYI